MSERLTGDQLDSLHRLGVVKENGSEDALVDPADLIALVAEVREAGAQKLCLMCCTRGDHSTEDHERLAVDKEWAEAFKLAHSPSKRDRAASAMLAALVSLDEFGMLNRGDRMGSEQTGEFDSLPWSDAKDRIRDAIAAARAAGIEPAK